ncbi:Transglycosylase SLT domain-containing protein [Asanoa hainanensis]|uniref:Transglycosylase SLT domain-containing protein n=1 Tax=Asanoa hainanensis TaxID=560556 RepID=A0A239P539_9ACTN|nr:lytic transglycosylase domain-containing protein [Asanoa hainanensis]SNT62241.1 Transglycosylase SLT domain-containing protein [Asanoa hainanensis]
MRRSRRLSITVCAVALALLVTGCDERGSGGSAAGGGGVQQVAAAGSSEQDAGDSSSSSSSSDAEAKTAAGLGAAPAATTTPPSPRPKPTKKSPPRRPTTEKLPSKAPPPDPGCTRPRYLGARQTQADVKTALTDAAAITYWPNSAPSIKVPLDLVKATAWQESGWQSNVIACDGGVGLMQVMAPTAEFVNQRFEKNYDLHAYRDNAQLGANYLAWLIKYFGDAYFESDYSVSAADCADHSDLCLLNVVIAAYNFGPGAVDTPAGLVIPNPGYVDNVRSLMTNCECLDF